MFECQALQRICFGLYSPVEYSLSLVGACLLLLSCCLSVVSCIIGRSPNAQLMPMCVLPMRVFHYRIGVAWACRLCLVTLERTLYPFLWLHAVHIGRCCSHLMNMKLILDLSTLSVWEFSKPVTCGLYGNTHNTISDGASDIQVAVCGWSGAITSFLPYTRVKDGQ